MEVMVQAYHQTQEVLVDILVKANQVLEDQVVLEDLAEAQVEDLVEDLAEVQVEDLAEVQVEAQVEDLAEVQVDQVVLQVVPQHLETLVEVEEGVEVMDLL